MDSIIEQLRDNYQLSDSEALVVLGIIGMSAYDEKETMQQAFNVVDNKLKTIAYNVAMA
jgi:hypothetical protein